MAWTNEGPRSRKSKDRGCRFRLFRVLYRLALNLTKRTLSSTCTFFILVIISSQNPNYHIQSSLIQAIIIEQHLKILWNDSCSCMDDPFMLSPSSLIPCLKSFFHSNSYNYNERFDLVFFFLLFSLLEMFCRFGIAATLL
jgi:hypothetical protein